MRGTRRLCYCINMNRLLVILVLALLSSQAIASDTPDFAWSRSFPAPVQTAVKQAESKWKQAAAVPTSPDCLMAKGSTCFDESYLEKLIYRKDYAYDLLDVSMTKLQRIDEARDLYTKAVSAAGSRAPASVKIFDAAYYELKSRIRLAIGLSRAEIAREMTDPDQSSYCFQAMESGIDALRDAAADAAKGPEGAKRAEAIHTFRSGLFSTWESAERQKDTGIIGAVDLIKLWKSSFNCKQAAKK